MPENDKIELFGFKELDEFFEKARRKDQRKIILDSFRISSKPLISLARQLLKSSLKSKSTSRNLEKSIGFVPLRASRNSVFVSAKVGARRFSRYRGYHGHLYDAGTGQRTTASGLDRGTMPASNFFTGALSQTEGEITNAIADNILTALDKFFQRELKKQAKNK